MALGAAASQAGLGRERLVVDQALQGFDKGAEFMKYGMQAIDELAGEIAAVEQDPDKMETRLAKFKVAMLEFCAMERDMKQFIAATKHIMHQPESAAPDANLVALLDARLLELSADCTDDELTEHPTYAALEQRIADATNPPDAAVDASELQAEEIQLDDDLAMTQPSPSTRCPYTGCEMARPVRNKHCSHNYERDGVFELIRHRGERARCPVSGCINERQLIEADLEENTELKQQIERAHRRKDGKKRAGKR